MEWNDVWALWRRALNVTSNRFFLSLKISFAAVNFEPSHFWLKEFPTSRRRMGVSRVEGQHLSDLPRVGQPEEDPDVDVEGSHQGYVKFLFRKMFPIWLHSRSPEERALWLEWLLVRTRTTTTGIQIKEGLTMLIVTLQMTFELNDTGNGG